MDSRQQSREARGPPSRRAQSAIRGPLVPDLGAAEAIRAPRWIAPKSPRVSSLTQARISDPAHFRCDALAISMIHMEKAPGANTRRGKSIRIESPLFPNGLKFDVSQFGPIAGPSGPGACVANRRTRHWVARWVFTTSKNDLTFVGLVDHVRVSPRASSATSRMPVTPPRRQCGR